MATAERRNSDRLSPPTPTTSYHPFRDFLGPARRRTDHPIVVGTIVLCLGITTLSSIVQIAATVWAGSQVRVLLDGQHERDQEVNRVRAALFKNTEASALVLRRLCLNTAQTDKDRQECLALGPPMPPTGEGGR